MQTIVRLALFCNHVESRRVYLKQIEHTMCLVVDGLAQLRVGGPFSESSTLYRIWLA
jgi:hypothetical protein